MQTIATIATIAIATIANIANNYKTPYATWSDIYSLVVPFERVSKKLLKWFDLKLLESYSGTCHLLVS